MTNQITGSVDSISGEIAQVQFNGEMPKLNDVLLGGNKNSIILQIYASNGKGRYYCMILKGKDALLRGMRLQVAVEPLSIPVGDAILGRVMNVFGDAVDGKGPLSIIERRPLFRQSLPYSQVTTKKEIWQTGIKSIDFFHP